MGRNVWIASGLATVGLGLFFGWGWLVAIGVAPFVIFAAPCLLMCALGGLCMMRQGHSSSAKNGPAGEDGK